VNDKFSQTDTMTAIGYTGGTLLVLPDHVNAKNFPRLAALTGRAMKTDAFAFTVTHP
jgi:glutathione S-transferase